MTDIEKDYFKPIILIGFTALIILVALQLYTGLQRLDTIGQSYMQVSQRSNERINATYQLHKAIENRFASLKSIVATTDPFKRGSEKVRFESLNDVFDNTLDKIRRLQPGQTEQGLLTRISNSEQELRKINSKALRALLKRQQLKKSAKLTVKSALKEHQALLALMQQLINAAQAQASISLTELRKNNTDKETHLYLFALVFLAVLFIIAWLVIYQGKSGSKKLSFAATHDIITGLINRQSFEQVIKNAIASAKAGKRNHALLYMDLDNFKIINDTCGHHAGDELLKQLKTILLPLVRDHDTMARIGGDEFGMLLQRCPARKGMRVAETMRDAVQEFRFIWDERSYNISASIGVVEIDRHSAGYEESLSVADAACSKAKDSGRNRVQLASNDDTTMQQRYGEMEWVRQVKAALEHNRFELYAQEIRPISDPTLQSHYEILLRMRDDKGNQVPPGAFITAAENYSLMKEVDRWVLLHTIAWLASPSGNHKGAHVAINLSGQSLSDRSFLKYAESVIKRSDLKPKQICLEITETSAIGNLNNATNFINTMRKLGCEVALDDFGSGLSSFAYLKSLPVDYLKIDGIFVKNLADNDVDYAMVKSINDVGHAMGKKTIAEYVENEAILEKLKEIGVDYAQGFCIHKPIALEHIKIKDTPWE
ncbi:MAG: EAL domain-containing protein [Gammaproteobacteria bacterium]|nr:EAL domain-containing protein [Gammaproteobacteria bacterium]